MDECLSGGSPHPSGRGPSSSLEPGGVSLTDQPPSVVGQWVCGDGLQNGSSGGLRTLADSRPDGRGSRRADRVDGSRRPGRLVTEYVFQPGYDFAAEFTAGLDLILAASSICWSRHPDPEGLPDEEPDRLPSATVPDARHGGSLDNGSRALTLIG